jgi:hypothetical protein
VRYQFPGKGNQQPIVLTWTHGTKPPPIFAEHRLPGWVWGVFVGSEGMLLANYPQHMLWPAEKFADYSPPAQTIPPSKGHHQEWIDACKTGGATSCNFDYAGAITETVLLGNIAYRIQERLSWDGKAMRFLNSAAGDQYLQREYRPGWS